MVAGAECIDDMGVLRHGATGKLFKGTYAPSTLGSSLHSFTFGHVRQLEAAAARWLPGLAAATGLASGIDELALVDIDDTIKEAYGYQQQGSGYGYTGKRGLNALIGTITTQESAPFIGGARLRKGAVNSARGAGVQRETAPTASHIPHTHTWPQAELAADQIELRLLSRIQVRILVLPDRAGVNHRRPKHERVEVVADVVMV